MTNSEKLEALREHNRDWYYALIGLSCGAREKGFVSPKGGLFIGKHESEPKDWRACYAYLQELGYVTFSTEIVDAPGAVSGKSENVYIRLTSSGWDLIDVWRGKAAA